MSSEDLGHKGKELLSHVKERVNNPFFSPYILSAIAVFWKQTIAIIDITQPFDKRIDYIESLPSPTWCNALWILGLGSIYHLYHFGVKTCFNKKYYKVENEALKASTIGGLREDIEKAQQDIRELHEEVNQKNEDIQAEKNNTRKTEKELKLLKEKFAQKEEVVDNQIDQIRELEKRNETIESQRQKEKNASLDIRVENSFNFKALKEIARYIDIERYNHKSQKLHALELKLIFFIEEKIRAMIQKTVNDGESKAYKDGLINSKHELLSKFNSGESAHSELEDLEDFIDNYRHRLDQATSNEILDTSRQIRELTPL